MTLARILRSAAHFATKVLLLRSLNTKKHMGPCELKLDGYWGGRNWAMLKRQLKIWRSPYERSSMKEPGRNTTTPKIWLNQSASKPQSFYSSFNGLNPQRAVSSRLILQSSQGSKKNLPMSSSTAWAWPIRLESICQGLFSKRSSSTQRNIRFTFTREKLTLLVEGTTSNRLHENRAILGHVWTTWVSWFCTWSFRRRSRLLVFWLGILLDVWLGQG